MTTIVAVRAALALVVCIGPALSAQAAPAGWRSQVDRPAGIESQGSPAEFSEMIPGMHITSGKAAGLVVFPADDSAAGRFMLDATISARAMDCERRDPADRQGDRHEPSSASRPSRIPFAFSSTGVRWARSRAQRCAPTASSVSDSTRG